MEIESEIKLSFRLINSFMIIEKCYLDTVKLMDMRVVLSWMTIEKDVRTKWGPSTNINAFVHMTHFYFVKSVRYIIFVTLAAEHYLAEKQFYINMQV